jgi:hypothetical protein
LHNEEYEIVGTKGERKVSYSLEEFKEIINEKYKKECILEDEIIIFKKN